MVEEVLAKVTFLQILRGLEFSQDGEVTLLNEGGWALRDVEEAICTAVPYECRPSLERLAFNEVARRRLFVSTVQLLANSAREQGLEQTARILRDTQERLVQVLFKPPAGRVEKDDSPPEMS